MRPRSLIRSGSGVVVATILGIGCGGYKAGPPTPQQSQSTRKITRSSEQVVTVDSAKKVAAQVADFVADAGGFVERSSETGHGGASVVCKVPAPAVESVMNQVAALGHEERRSLTAHDVTDQYTDLEARLKSSIAVRDRLEQLLANANGITDVLTVERELARVQADIETMQARLEQLKSQVQLAELSVTLQRKRQLGPLASVGVGLWRGIGKLF
ncbi:MAG TPA: DUF4349 domain-containing protein [Gemmatimonadales bacterium]|nr:DUF4349 domain-containing protein [Gemmatimonadales bacterium]